MIADIIIGKLVPVISWNVNCFFLFLRRLRRIFAETILSSEDTPSKGFLTSAASVNKICNDFKLAELTADDLKCLIFAQGLVSAGDAEVRRRVLTKFENEQGLTLQK